MIAAATEKVATREIVVWWIPQWGDETKLAAAYGDLPAEDAARAAGMRRRRDRWAFVLRRSGLRRILAARTAIEPKHLRLEVEPHGRLRCPDLVGDDVRFSLAQRDAWAVVAVGRGVQPGVDVERRDLVPRSRLAERLLDAAALDAWRDAIDPGEAYTEAWTRLEATVKMSGIGLAEAQRRLVSGAPLPPARTVLRLSAPPGYVATLAACSPAHATAGHRLPPRAAAAPRR